MAGKAASLSIVTDTATSEVVTISIGVLYFSKISNTFRRKPYANNILLLFIFTAVMPSFAATAFAPFADTSDDIVVPFAVGSIVFSNLTGTLYCCAGHIEAG